MLILILYHFYEFSNVAQLLLIHLNAKYNCYDKNRDKDKDKDDGIDTDEKACMETFSKYEMRKNMHIKLIY